MEALVARYDALSADLRQAEVGWISSDIRSGRTPGTTDDSGEYPAGNLIADAQLADTDDADRGGAVVALMNPGGVRADFVYANSGAPQDVDGRVSYEEAFTVQPFNNLVATQTFTGAQLLDVLKDQWCGTNTSATVLLPSASLNYTYDQSIAASILGQPCAGAANPVSGVTINGTRARSGRVVPDHDEQLPRRRRGRFRLAEGGDRPHDAVGLRHRLAGALPGADDRRAHRSGRRRSTGSTSRRRRNAPSGRWRPCAAAARSVTIERE